MMVFKKNGMLTMRAEAIVREQASPNGDATLVYFDPIGASPFADREEWMRLMEDGAIQWRPRDWRYREWRLVACAEVVYQ